MPTPNRKLGPDEDVSDDDVPSLFHSYDLPISRPIFNRNGNHSGDDTGSSSYGGSFVNDGSISEHSVNQIILKKKILLNFRHFNQNNNLHLQSSSDYEPVQLRKTSNKRKRNGRIRSLAFTSDDSDTSISPKPSKVNI